MPKATLTFDLTDQDDLIAFKMATQGEDVVLMLWRFLHEDLRSMTKYNILPVDLDHEIKEELLLDEVVTGEFIPSNVTGTGMLTLVHRLIYQRIREAKLDIEVQ